MCEVSADNGLLIASLLIFFDVKVSVFPHNIEFMVPGQKQRFFRSLVCAQAAELRVYRAAEKVETISHFDSSILSCFGVTSSSCFPYFPSDKDLKFCNEVSEARSTSGNKDGILLFGTVGNPPTRRGMLYLLDLIAKSKEPRNYILAGFGTEDLTDEACSYVKVAGSVTDDELFSILVSCECALIYQPPTTGMLTKLIEFEVAGVPVYVLGGYMQAFELASNVKFINALSDIPLSTVSEM